MAVDFKKSTDYPSGVVTFSKAVIPAAIIMAIGGVKFGYIQNIEEGFSREVAEQYEIGSVGVVEGLPGQPKYTLRATKLKTYGKSFVKAAYESAFADNETLKNNIKAQISAGSSSSSAEDEVFSLLIHQVLPFDLEVRELNYGIGEAGTPEDFNFDIDSKTKLITVYKGCWITNYTKTINQGTVNIVENADIFVTRPIFKV